jgi:hypothetical protein
MSEHEERDLRGGRAGRDGRAVPDPSGSGAVNSTPGPETPGFDPDQELRDLFQGTVADLKPSEGALDRLRVAVPRRRALKRNALVGACAAALLIGISVPAFLQVAKVPGDSTDHTAMAGHGEYTQDGGSAIDGVSDPDLTWPGLPDPDVRPSAAAVVDRGKDGKGDKDGKDGKGGKDQGKGGTDPGTTGGPGADPAPADGAALPPACQADQLGVALQDARTPDADGKVYGTFRITNVSQGDCTVSGEAAVKVSAGGTADPARITVARHTAGGPATGLPEPAASTGLVLSPNSAYEVQFAWVPEQACPPPTPPTQDATPGSGTGTAEPTAASGEPGTEGDGLDDNDPLGDDETTDPDGDASAGRGSIEVVHTAEAGAPAAKAVIPNACAGTVYHTDVLPAGPGA